MQANQSLERVLREYYLDWVNNFLTVARFAEYHGLTTKQAQQVIEMGRDLHESYCDMMKG